MSTLGDRSIQRYFVTDKRIVAILIKDFLIDVSFIGQQDHRLTMLARSISHLFIGHQLVVVPVHLFIIFVSGSAEKAIQRLYVYEMVVYG